MSFTAGTKVLLASGAAIPISQLKAGDKVLATNTKAGKTRAQSVAAVLVNHDTNLYDLTIRTRSGSAVIHTTSNHPFFDLTRHRWVRAGALEHGDRLRSSDGTIVTVSGGRTPKVTTGWMWDLTVPGGGDHDFYIQAASTAVLVHNCAMPSSGGGPALGEVNELRSDLRYQPDSVAVIFDETIARRYRILASTEPAWGSAGDPK